MSRTTRKRSRHLGFHHRIEPAMGIWPARCVYISYINYSPWLGSEWDFSPTIDDFPLKSSIAVVWVIGDVMIGNVQPTIYVCIYIEAMKYMFAWVSPTTWMISQNLDPCFGRIRSKLKQNSKKTKEYGRDAVASTPWGWTVWPVPMRWPGRGELWDDWIWLAPRNL